MLTGYWNDLERHLSLGLRIIGVEVGRDGVPVITAEIPEKVKKDMESNMKTRKQKPSLMVMMVTLSIRAEQNWGQVQRMTLSGGLGIDLMCGIDGKRRLQIWRVGVYPAAKEWEIVVGCCPGAPKKMEYEQFMSKGRGYLRGEWGMGEEGDRGKGAGA
jgi:hypothetical protein